MKISKHISIVNGEVAVNGQPVFSNKEAESVNVFLKSVYKEYEIKYPKYFKMDRLSKLGFIASEILLKGENLSEKYSANEVGVIISNSSSTIDVDTKFYKTLTDKDGIPSPALFVYTLPNIMIGEICIRNEFRGEIALLISKEFNAEQLYNYTKSVFANNKKIKTCVIGRVELSSDTNYNANLFLIEAFDNNEKNTTFDVSNIINKYK